MGEERGGNWRIKRREEEKRLGAEGGRYVCERKKGMIRSMHAFYNTLVVSIGYRSHLYMYFALLNQAFRDNGQITFPDCILKLVWDLSFTL